MENKYKSMISKCALSASARERIKNVLNEDNVHSMVNNKLLRVVVIAACFALLLMGCAFVAIEIFGVPTIINKQTGESASSYQVTGEVQFFRIKKELAPLNRAIEKGDIRTSFEKKTELEKYLGLMLIDSSILETAGIVENLEESLEYGFDLYPALKKDANSRYVVSMLDDDRAECTKDPHIITVTSHRVIKNMEIYIEANIFTELFDPEKIEGVLLTDNYKSLAYLVTTLTRDENCEIMISTEKYYDAQYSFTAAEYVMKNGNKALVVTAEKNMGEYNVFEEYIAYYLQGGVLYSFRPYAIYDPNVDENYLGSYGLDVLYEVLDSIE